MRCGCSINRGRSLINWIAELAVGPTLPAGRDWNRRGDKADFTEAFAEWRFDWLDVPALVDGAAEEFEFPMVDRDPLERWSFGGVTLLGDAAHPMYPIGSNGASQAILDAEALAATLAGMSDVESALRQYEAARLPPSCAAIGKWGPKLLCKWRRSGRRRGFDRSRT
jgi:5-methylphenazine-1-carboxylate 1-monooxygenase